MRSFALSALGSDRPGIVAGVSRVLLEHEINIEDSQMTILRGHFAMTLIVATADDLDDERLLADLAGAREQLGLDAVTLNEITETGDDGPEPSHIVSVYGVDHPGIVHAVSTALAERSIGITDLETRVLGDQSNPLYVMVIEVAVPGSAGPAELDELLARIGEEQDVEITARPLEQDVL
ncbi:MAG: amino acid-binding protein [Thermoleophilaceae bacterium]|nr:amino acid-binding protein [Thermoleophilaceae bacterium]